ncbi:MAG: hypothetical protein JSS04_25230 [Proteobacteria bacterium]|nr:hypothetical protein [Pseudomonadota bacterium]
MQRRTKRQAKSHASNNGKKRPQPTNAVGLWSVKPEADLSLLLSKVRAVQVKRLHLR